jgi:hypothetical protein
MISQETKYHYIIKGIEFYNPDPRFNSTKSRRVDKLTRKKDGEIFNESYMCIDHNDMSDLFSRGENGEYNPDCYGCWAGCGHTLNYHNSHNKKQL